MIPEGKHLFKIAKAEESTSAKGNFMVKIKCEVINNPELVMASTNHTVTFVDPTSRGAGMAVHFLKTIEEPWEGKIQVVPENWVGCTFWGTVKHEQYQSKKDGKTYTSAKIIDVQPSGEIPF
jgi:hypothetical protein